jgi:hypothetical protein
MRRVAAMLSAAVILSMVAGVYAQAPSFAGKWVREAPAGGAAAAGGGGGGRAGGGGGRGGGGGGFTCGMECEIAQTAALLTVTRAGMDGAPIKSEFKLDGSDSSNPGGRGGAMVVSKAKVDGAKIVITTTRDMQGTSITSTQTLTLEGGKLVIETNSGMDGATPTKVTYTKG